MTVKLGRIADILYFGKTATCSHSSSPLEPDTDGGLVTSLAALYLLLFTSIPIILLDNYFNPSGQAEETEGASGFCAQGPLHSQSGLEHDMYCIYTFAVLLLLRFLQFLSPFKGFFGGSFPLKNQRSNYKGCRMLCGF